jgi:hypothetical protein
VDKQIIKVGKALASRFFICDDIWTFCSTPAAERWLSAYPQNSPFYWIMETSMRGICQDILEVISDLELVRYEQCVAVLEVVKVRMGAPPVIGITPDFEPAPEITYQPALATGHNARLEAAIKALGSFAWGAMVYQGVPLAGRVLQVSISVRSMHDKSSEVVLGNVNIGFVQGFLRSTQYPRFTGEDPSQAVYRWSPTTPAQGRIQINMDSQRTNIASRDTPLQFKHSAAIVRQPGLGLQVNIASAVFDY